MSTFAFAGTSILISVGVALELLRGLDLDSLPRAGDIAMDGSVIAFTTLLGVGAALVLLLVTSAFSMLWFSRLP